MAQNEVRAKDGLPVPVRLTEGLGRRRGFEGREPVIAFIELEDTGIGVWDLRRFCAAREPDLCVREAHVFVVKTIRSFGRRQVSKRCACS